MPPAPASRSRYKLFISYRHDDDPDFVELLHSKFERQFKVFMDSKNISAGEQWREVIRPEVRGCDALVVIVGPKWLKTIRERAAEAFDPVREEIKLALAEKKVVIPIRIKNAPELKPEAIHYQVRDLLKHQIFDLTQGNHWRIEGLIRSIRRTLGKRARFERKAPKAESGPAPTSRAIQGITTDNRTDVRAAHKPPREVSVTELGDVLWRSIPREGSLEVDVIAYTGETLHISLNALHDAMAKAPCQLQRLKVRLLTWDCGGQPVLPLNAVTLKRDETYLDDMKKRCARSHSDYLQGKTNQSLLAIERADVKVEFESKFSPFEPSIKAVLIRGVAVYWCLYSIEVHAKTFRNVKHGTWDYEGFRRSLSEAPAGSAAYDSIDKWFNTVWDNFAKKEPRN